MLKVMIDGTHPDKDNIKWAIYTAIRNDVDIIEYDTWDWQTFVEDVRNKAKYADDTLVLIGFCPPVGLMDIFIHRTKYLLVIDNNPDNGWIKDKPWSIYSETESLFDLVWDTYNPKLQKPSFINVVHSKNARGY